MLLDSPRKRLGDFFVAWNGRLPTRGGIDVDVVSLALPSQVTAQRANLVQQIIVAHACNPLHTPDVLRQFEFD